MEPIEFGPIVGVAIKYDGEIFKLPAPSRHHDVIRMIASKNGVGINGPDVQGFYDTSDIFITREEAVSVATVYGQLKPGTKIIGNRLYSEDLW